MTGVYEGFSANYSGAGFNGMRFKFHGLQDEDFDEWIARVKAQGEELTRPVYKELEKPSQNEPVRYYRSVMPGLYDKILNRCVDPGTLCMKDMMGGHQHAGHQPEKAEHHDAH